MKHSIILCIIFTVFSCKETGRKVAPGNDTTIRPSVEQSPFGMLPDGQEITKFTLTNIHGMKVSIITFGGIIQSIMVPDKDGNLGDVVLGHDSIAGYLNQNPYFGGIIGRYGNRIAKGKFTLDGKEYHLNTNDSFPSDRSPGIIYNCQNFSSRVIRERRSSTLSSIGNFEFL